MDFKKLNRINVVGTSGCGKSTFSRKLSEILTIPYLEIDQIYWKKNWGTPTKEEFFGKLTMELEKKTWILDGNYSTAIPVKWKNVETVIWLDYPFYKIFFRGFVRSVIRAITKQELWAGTGNRESFKALFSKDSIPHWIIKTFRKNRKEYNKIILENKYPNIQFIRLTTKQNTEEFLARVKSEIRKGYIKSTLPSTSGSAG